MTAFLCVILVMKALAVGSNAAGLARGTSKQPAMDTLSMFVNLALGLWAAWLLVA